MPKAKPIAIIDIGSNSVRLVVYEPPYIGEAPVFNEKVQCGLGADLEKTGALNPAAKFRTMHTLSGFVALCEAMEITDIVAIATAAMRDASDGPEFATQIKDKLGLNVQIISGEEEAEFAALGVLAAFPAASGIVADLGGGSLELARIKDGEIFERTSLPLGVLRIMGKDNPLDFIDRKIVDIDQIYRGQRDFYVIGGTWRALGQAKIINSGKKLADVHGYKMNAEKLCDFSLESAGKDADYFMNTYHFEQKRSELMPTSALLMSRLLPALRVKTVIVSTSGLREGLLRAHLQGRI